MKARVLVMCGVLVLTGCGARDGESPDATGTGAPGASEAPAQTAPAEPAPALPVTWQEAANAIYAGPMGMAITFHNGEWQGEPYAEGAASAPRAGLAPGFLLEGDLDADGAPESVVLVWTSTGGSGTFDYLVVVERTADGTVSERASVPLGDRVQIRRADIIDGAVALDIVQAGPEDARCCPGQKARRVFALEGDTMTEMPPEDRGRLSLADLDGEWTLTELGRGVPVPDSVTISARIEGGQVAGSAGCNRYSGRLQEGDAPGDVALAGPLSTTRMMCPPETMDWENRFLEALAGVRKFSFTAGHLVLTWTTSAGVDSLVFAPVDTSAGYAFFSGR